MFPIVHVDRSRAEAVEPLGSKWKFWFSDGPRRLLFKAEERGTGEDWAEKVACHLCKLLGLPHVHYEMASLFDGGRFVQPGVVCESCAPHPRSLVLGNQLLLSRVPGYPATDDRKYKVREHSVQAVSDVLHNLAVPAPEWMTNAPAGMSTAIDVFIGYVLLDAWIANQDRHHENWAAIRDTDLRLAPTFDHGASLARNLTDDARKERLETRDRRRTVAFFASKAASAFFGEAASSKPLGTLEAFAAFAKLAPQAANTWLGRLAAIDSAAVKQIVDEVPEARMTRISKDFTLELLKVNQARLQQEQV